MIESAKMVKAASDVIPLSKRPGDIVTPRLGMVLLANASWALFPIYIIYRMWRNPKPFTRQ
jgi:hypothetical protein